MSHSTPNITALASDYYAIERALRETTRGRWFLNCYLERNRSAETHLLLDAIARLEGAMRENGHIASSFAPSDTIAMIAEAIADARSEMKRMVATDQPTPHLPTARFSFADLSQPVSAAASDIRDAARAIEIAVSALRDAGVFQGVSRQIAGDVQTIVGACAAQERAILQVQRMAALIGEIEAEIMAAMDNGAPDTAEDADGHSAEIRQLHPQDRQPAPHAIPGDVISELSAVLARGMAPLSIASLSDPQ